MVLMFVERCFRVGITVIYRLQNTIYHYNVIFTLASVPVPNLINLLGRNAVNLYEPKTENLKWMTFGRSPEGDSQESYMRVCEREGVLRAAAF